MDECREQALKARGAKGNIMKEKKSKCIYIQKGMRRVPSALEEKAPNGGNALSHTNYHA
jgi:hypothetical protein